MREEREDERGELSFVSPAGGAKVDFTALVKREKPKLGGVIGSSNDDCKRLSYSDLEMKFVSDFIFGGAIFS